MCIGYQFSLLQAFKSPCASLCINLEKEKNILVHFIKLLFDDLIPYEIVDKSPPRTAACIAVSLFFLSKVAAESP